MSVYHFLGRDNSYLYEIEKELLPWKKIDLDLSNIMKCIFECFVPYKVFFLKLCTFHQMRFFKPLHWIYIRGFGFEVQEIQYSKLLPFYSKSSEEKSKLFLFGLFYTNLFFYISMHFEIKGLLWKKMSQKVAHADNY